MKITRSLVDRILRYMGFGMPNGVGHGGDGRMCVQHVVARSEYEESGRYGSWFGPTDHPTCVADCVREVGIALNDAPWSSDKARGEGMKRFAIAELGTKTDDYKLDCNEFYERYNARSNEIDARWNRGDYGLGGPYRMDRLLTDKCNAAADVLAELGSPGSAYLCVIDKPVPDIEPDAS